MDKPVVISINKLESINRYPEAVNFLSLLFKNAGIRISDSGVEFSCHHHGSRIKFEQHLDESKVDYILELDTEQVHTLTELITVPKIDDIRKYRILNTLFSPAIETSVNPFDCLKGITRSNPLLSNSLLRRVLRMENLIHVYIEPPLDEEPEIGHTLIFAKKEWLIFKGIHGNPGRVFRLTVDDALDFHKHAFIALKSDSKMRWLTFVRWYLIWRHRVSGG